jgi:DTW domain-containing protein YfiP
VLRGKDEPYDSVVVLFPHEDAVDINAMSEQELRAIKKVVLIDSTWSQTRHYMRSE